MKLLNATPQKQCDNCVSQEGRHYCLFHGKQIKNMDIYRCADWKPKADSSDSELHAIVARYATVEGDSFYDEEERRWRPISEWLVGEQEKEEWAATHLNR